jgi:methyl-accepting chemotaxis protein
MEPGHLPNHLPLQDSVKPKPKLPIHRKIKTMNSTFWTISRRIIAGFAMCVLITAGLGLFAMRQVESLTTNISDLNDNVIPSLVLLSDISDNFQDIMIILEQIDGETSVERISQLEKKNNEFNARVEDCLKKYEPLVISEEDGRLLKEIKRNYESFFVGRARTVELIKQNQTAEVNQQMQSVVIPLYDNTTKSINEHVEFNTKLGEAQAAKGKLTAQAAEKWFKVFLLSALLVASLIGWAISSTTNRVLRGLAMSLDHGALQTAAAARQVSVASQTLSSGASEQASSVEETSASLEEMTSMIRATSENAQKAKSLASDSRTFAEAGSKNMHEMMIAMSAIDSSSAEVAKIVKDIDEIAFQTNILALNAAVEAARAGEAGAGFAVVADEVRSLAQRSAAAAKETANKIEAAISNSRQGSLNSSKVAESLKQISEKVASTDTLVGDISTASREQSQGIDQINSAIAQMEKVTQSNASSAEESASAAEELSAQAETLRDLVGKLRRLVGGKTEGTNTQFHSPSNQEGERHHSNHASSGITKNKNRTTIPMPEDKRALAGNEDRDFRNF